MNWLNLPGPILATTVYADGRLVAKDVSFTLPAVESMMADYQAMGTMSAPVTGMFENMEFSINKIGIDFGLRTMLKLKSQNFEFRGAQDVMKQGGGIDVVGFQAFVRGFPAGIPGLEIEPGSPSENEVSCVATRYQLYLEGQEYLLVDRLAHILRVAGVDYAENIYNLM